MLHVYFKDISNYNHSEVEVDAEKLFFQILRESMIA
jgi:hypothetical protein